MDEKKIGVNEANGIGTMLMCQKAIASISSAGIKTIIIVGNKSPIL